MLNDVFESVAKPAADGDQAEWKRSYSEGRQRKI